VTFLPQKKRSNGAGWHIETNLIGKSFLFAVGVVLVGVDAGISVNDRDEDWLAGWRMNGDASLPVLTASPTTNSPPEGRLAPMPEHHP
jgi:hypothetical protein